jgi:hypothetical protein
MIRAALAAIAGLFVDDGSLALAIVILIAVLAVAVKSGSLTPLAGGIALLAGCVVLLVESVFRAARRKKAGG